MYQATTGLLHLLSPTDYCDPSAFRLEFKRILRPAWHLVGTKSQLSSSGQFITCQLLGKEIYVRNFDGNLRVFANVCAHRHCMIQSVPEGKSETMQCQYHGWEYGEDGATRKIPCAKDFAPLDRSQLRLPSYRVDSCGELVFVSLVHEGVSLQDFLGEAYEVMSERFSSDMKQNYRKSFEYDANWKVAIENSLEAYHVESVHPETFRSSPGEERTEHHLGSQYTSFTTDMPFAVSNRTDLAYQKAEGWFVKKLGREPKRRYSQHHVFPNLLFSCTDAISLVHSVRPISVNRSESICIQFGLSPKSSKFAQKKLAGLLGKAEAMIINRILKEDVAMYPVIQRGLEVSSHPGMLARSEERIHAFQQYLRKFQ